MQKKMSLFSTVTDRERPNLLVAELPTLNQSLSEIESVAVPVTRPAVTAHPPANATEEVQEVLGIGAEFQNIPPRDPTPTYIQTHVMSISIERD